ncbi:MAG: LysM peptidoglycan-binding domain-containing protein [Planctomycetota bacterium]
MKGPVLSTAARFGLVALMFLLIAVFILIEKTCIPKHEEDDINSAYARFLEPFDAPSPPVRTLSPIARNGDPARTATPARTYKVQPGDSLSRIASRTLGSSGKWKKIARLNGIDNPRLIRIGQVLKIPASSE